MKQYNTASNNKPSGDFPHKDHISFIKKLLRGLLSALTSIGFAGFWYALAAGIKQNLLFFIGGIILMVMGLIHIAIGIKNDKESRRMNAKRHRK